MKIEIELEDYISRIEKAFRDGFDYGYNAGKPKGLYDNPVVTWKGTGAAKDFITATSGSGIYD